MLELSKDYVRINRVLKTETARNVYETDCIVPDTLPDAVRLLALDAAAVTEETVSGNGSMTVKFRIFYKILYMTDSAECLVKSFRTASEHVCVFEVPEISADCSLRAVSTAENWEYTLLNSRKFQLRTTVRIEPEVLRSEELAVTSALSGLPGMQLQSRRQPLTASSGSITSTLTFSEKAELPAGKAAVAEILRSDPRISDVTVQLSGDKLQFRGNLCICTLYMAEDREQSLQVLENQFPFTQAVPISSASDGEIWIPDFTLRLFKCECGEDSDGEQRILTFSATVDFRADAYQTTECEMLEDAYAPGYVFSLKTETVPACVGLEEVSGQFVLKDVLTLPDGNPAIREIVNVTGNIGTVQATCEDGKITLDGFILCHVLYFSTDDGLPLSSFSVKLPFTQALEDRRVKNNLKVRLRPDLNHISFSILSGQELELRIAVSVCGSLCRLAEIPIITEATEPIIPEKSEADRAAVILYVVQKGDTLWKIAKHYGVSAEQLALDNALKNPDLLMPGQKLILTR